MTCGIMTQGHHDNDDDDEVLCEWDVFVGTELSPFLHLCPLQSASLAARFNSLAGGSSGRFKPASKRLELNLPFSGEERGFLEGERAQQLQMSAGIKISGSGWPWRPVQYLVGRFQANELFLCPVESVIPLSPNLSNLDEFEARQRAASTLPRQRSDDSITQQPSTTPTTGSTRTIQMQFRKKETEEQVQARLNSYAYLQRQVDDEAWLQLKHFSGPAPEVDAVKERMIVGCRDPIEFVKDEKKDYLDLVIGIDALKASQELEEVVSEDQ